MNLIRKCACFLALLVAAFGLAAPALADNGDGSASCGPDPVPMPCINKHSPAAAQKNDFSRPGSVLVFPLFVRGGGDTEACGAGNVFVDGVCLPRTEIELGATCPTRFTTGVPVPPGQAGIPCFDDEPVRVRFNWVCPGIQDFTHKFICKTTGFDVLLSLNGRVVFTANGFRLSDANQVRVPAAPCDKGYLIGWVIKDGQPIKYDGLIGEAVIRNSGTAVATYRGIPIQAEATTPPGSIIDLEQDPLMLKSRGLFFSGNEKQYRLVTGQITGDVTFDKAPSAAEPGFGTTTSLILLTLDVRSNSPNFPTFVALEFWNGFEEILSTFVEFVCWGEFQLSANIDVNLTQEFMGTRKGIVQSGEAIKVAVRGVSDVTIDLFGHTTTLLGLVQTIETPAGGPATRSHIVEFYNNGIRYPPTIFFPK